jgi:hypothetical protein
MDYHITCPECNRIITNDPLIEAAAKEENLGSSSITCECGHKISFWAISAQLRKQHTLGGKISALFHKKGPEKKA